MVAATRAILPRTYLAENRVVFTYEIADRSHGVLTGYESDGGFFLEHMIAFPGTPPSTLQRMLHAGIAEAWKRGYLYIALFVEHEHPLAAKLVALAQRLEFVRYADLDARAYFCRHRKTHEIPQETE